MALLWCLPSSTAAAPPALLGAEHVGQKLAAAVAAVGTSAVVVIGCSWLIATTESGSGTSRTGLDRAAGLVGTAISFLFLYPAHNLLEIPAVLKPQVRMYATGIIRVSRHPQAIGQILWCCTHLLWIGSSFMVATCVGLIAHHLFAVWNGDRRLSNRFGEAFEELRASTSIVPFRAVLDGRQQLVASEFLRPAQLGIAIAVGVFWWAHRYIGVAATGFS